MLYKAFSYCNLDVFRLCVSSVSSLVVYVMKMLFVIAGETAIPGDKKDEEAVKEEAKPVAVEQTTTAAVKEDK